MSKLPSLFFASLLLGCGATPGDGADAATDAPPLAPLSDWLSLSEVSIFQAVRVPLMKDGAPAGSNTPVIASRPAFVRAYVTVSGKRAASHPVDAELHLSNLSGEIAVLKDTGKSILESSTDESLPSTFDFQLDATTLQPGLSFSIVLRDPTQPSDPVTTIVYPPDGSTQDLSAVVAPDLKIELVPVRYDADGSGRLPDSSAQQIQRFHDTLYEMYPVSNVTVTTHDPMPWSQTVSPDGTGWDALISAVMDLRGQDNAPDDLYYVATFDPNATVQEFCMQGCVEGIGLLDGEMYPAARVALVLGYHGQYPANTLNQELAHDMGRLHAPCGNPDSVDPKFPYLDGGIGDWGWDLLANTWIDPSAVSDFMSYCSPIWVSDYTYSAISKQMFAVQKSMPQKAQLGPTPARALRLAPDGTLRDLGTVRLSAPIAPTTTSRHVQIEDPTGHVLVRSNRFVSLGALGGSLVFLPASYDVSALRHARGRLSGE